VIILGDKITLSKDAVYGSVIAVLAVLLIASVFTAGFGVVKAECPAVEQPTQPAETAKPVETDTAETEEPGPAPLGTLTVDAGDATRLGDENAPVTLVHFSEFPCPYCASFYKNTEGKLKTNYVDNGKMKLYFRDFLIHPDYAIPAAQAARCAGEQGMFWEMHDKIFENRDSWIELSNYTPTFTQYAVDLGLDNESFSTCISDENAYVDEMYADMQAGRDAGVQGTPSSFIIIPKSNADEESIRDAVDVVNAMYGGITLYENDNEYTVYVPGAYPYDTFSTVLDAVDY